MNNEFKDLLDCQLSDLKWKQRDSEAVLQLVRGGTKVKKKMSVAMVVVMILILALIGVAVAAGFSIFGRFAEKNSSKDLAALETTATKYGNIVEVVPKEDDFPTASFALDQAYYDGESLYISYTFSGGKPQATFMFVKPTEEQLKNFTSMENMSTDWKTLLNETDNDKIQSLLRDNGYVYIKVCKQFLGDGIYLGDGVTLEQSEGNSETRDDGSIIGYWKFNTPLPDSARNKDRLDMTFVMQRSATYYYVTKDGSWCKSERMEDASLPATVLRNADSKSLTGNGSFERYDASISANSSDIEILADVILKLNKDWMALWQEYEYHFEKDDFLEDYVLYADGVPCQQNSFGAYTITEDTLELKIGFNAPQKYNTLVMRPDYTLSGEHADEEIILK